MKNKTFVIWLTFLGGPLGLHRFYLKGMGDWLGWLLPLPTALGVYGIDRAQNYGLDDHLSWILIPILGFTIAGCALRAILYGLMSTEDWNKRFNPQADPEAKAGATNWFTVMTLSTTLLVGAAILMASIALSYQRYFEYQIEEAQKISQPDND